MGCRYGLASLWRLAVVGSVVFLRCTLTSAQTSAVATREGPVTPRFQRLWTWRGDQPLAGPPAWDGVGWIALTSQGRLTALDATGGARWSQFVTNTAYAAAPVAVGGRVLTLTQGGQLAAWRSSDGAPVWQALVEGRFSQSPLPFMRGALPAVGVISTQDGRITCLDLATGTQVWQSESTQRTDGSMAADARWIAFGNCDAAIYAYAVANGQRAARISVGEQAQMAGGVAIADGRVYGGTRDGRLVCAEVEAARLLWSVEISASELFTTPLLLGDRVVIGTGDGDLVALNSETGKLLWRRNLVARAGSPVFATGALWLVADGRVLALDPATGREWFSFAAGDRVSDPVAGGDQIVVVDDQGGMLVFGKL